MFQITFKPSTETQKTQYLDDRKADEHAQYWVVFVTEILCLPVNDTEEKSLRHVAIAAKILGLNKPWSFNYGRQKKTRMIVLRNKTVVHTFLPSIDNANGRLPTKIVEIQKFCYHGNVTSPFPFLSWPGLNATVYYLYDILSAFKVLFDLLSDSCFRLCCDAWLWDKWRRERHE